MSELASSLGLHQLISEPTNFEPNKNPSCIDLIFCDNPNIIMESGVRPSLDNFCHHQIVFGKLNLHIPPPPIFLGKFGITTKLTSMQLHEQYLNLIGKVA